MYEEDLPHHRVHHPHHDYPFNVEEAMWKQSEAMESARRQALAQLEAAHGRQPVPEEGRDKGPRLTYETSTSGPSFGHLLHQNGQPIPRHLSAELPSMQDVPGPQHSHLSRELAGLSGGSFFRIPFGVPMGARMPHPLMMTRQGTSVGLGLGFGGAQRMEGVTGVAESPEGTRGRSAYVESVEDVSTYWVTSKRLTAIGTGASCCYDKGRYEDRQISGCFPL